jgi:hypothetical protein
MELFICLLGNFGLFCWWMACSGHARNLLNELKLTIGQENNLIVLLVDGFLAISRNLFNELKLTAGQENN